MISYNVVEIQNASSHTASPIFMSTDKVNDINFNLDSQLYKGQIGEYGVKSGVPIIVTITPLVPYDLVINNLVHDCGGWDNCV